MGFSLGRAKLNFFVLGAKELLGKLDIGFLELRDYLGTSLSSSSDCS